MKESWARRSAPDKRTADVQCEKKALGSGDPEGTGLTDRGIAPSLSQPLSEEERNKLIEEHMKLVRPLAMGILNRYTLPFDMLAELEADGRLGLVEAARRYQPRAGGSFGAYANAWIRGRILGGLKRAIPLRESFRKAEDEPACEIENTLMDDIELSQLWSMLDQLTERQATVVTERIKHHKTFDQIAKQLGVTKGTAHSILCDATAKLKLFISGHEVKSSVKRRQQRRDMIRNSLCAAIPSHMTERDVALAAGISRVYLQKIKNHTCIPSLGVALLLAKALGSRVEELFQLRDGTSPGAATNR